MRTACSNHSTAFSDYGVSDGSRLIHGMRRDLADDGYDDFDPSAAFFNRLGTSFRTAFERVAGVRTLPDPVDEALSAALTTTAHRYVDDPDVDLRTDVLPDFYKTLAQLRCADRGSLIG